MSEKVTTALTGTGIAEVAPQNAAPIAPRLPPTPIRRPITPMSISQLKQSASRQQEVGVPVAEPAFDLTAIADQLLVAEIEMLAEAYDVPAAMPLISILVTSATAIGSLVRVGVGAVRSEPPVLWGVIVAPPGSRKTDMTELPKTMLKAAARAEFEAWRRDREAAQAKKSLLDIEWRVHRAEQRKAIVKDLAEPEAPSRSLDSLALPIRPALIIEDSTVEEMTESLAGSPRGVLALADEAATLLGQGRQMRARLLQSTGGGALRVGRISRDSHELQSLAVCILAGTQPDKVAALVGKGDDGLAGRFFWVWIEEDREPRISRVALKLDRLLALVARLRAMGEVAEPTIIPIDEAGLDRLELAMKTWKDKGKRVGGLLQTWYAKAGGHAAKLALVLETIARARETDTLPASVSLTRIEAAITLIDRLFAPGMARIAQHVTQDPSDQIRSGLLKYLLANGIDRFRARELRRSRVRLFGTPAAFEQVLKELESEGILQRADRQLGAQGRSPGDYLVDHSKLTAAEALGAPA